MQIALHTAAPSLLIAGGVQLLCGSGSTSDHSSKLGQLKVPEFCQEVISTATCITQAGARGMWEMKEMMLS